MEGSANLRTLCGRYVSALCTQLSACTDVDAVRHLLHGSVSALLDRNTSLEVCEATSNDGARADLSADHWRHQVLSQRDKSGLTQADVQDVFYYTHFPVLAEVLLTGDAPSWCTCMHSCLLS